LIVSQIENVAMQHLEHLCAEIGPRPVGSKANQAAAEYIRGVFEANGLEVDMQPFSCPTWEEAATYLELDGSVLDAFGNTFSPPCNVTAPTIALGTIAELEAADLVGRIGVLYGDLAKGTGLSNRRGYYYPERDQKIVGLLEQKKPAALIFVQSKAGCRERMIQDWEFPIPSATVPRGVGLRLLETIGQSVCLSIDCQGSLDHFHNVLASNAGAGPGRVVLLAHFDTMADSPGAIDNGSGVAVLLALAEALNRRDLALGLEFIAVNGEEVGGLGDVEYLLQRGSELEEVLVAINADGVGQKLGANSITMMGCSQAFQDRVRGLHQKYPGVVWVEPWYESDHTAFLTRGVPCIPIGSVGIGDVLHCPVDTVQWISPTKLGEVVSFVMDIVQVLHDKAPGWCRE
jgi:aminopeptidase YwaD